MKEWRDMQFDDSECGFKRMIEERIEDHTADVADIEMLAYLDAIENGGQYERT